MRVIFYLIFSTIDVRMYFTTPNMIFFVSLFFPSVVLIYCTDYFISFSTNPLMLLFLVCLLFNIFSIFDTYTSILEICFPLNDFSLFFVMYCNFDVLLFFPLSTWSFIYLLYVSDLQLQVYLCIEYKFILLLTKLIVCPILLCLLFMFLRDSVLFPCLLLLMIGLFVFSLEMSTKLN